MRHKDPAAKARHFPQHICLQAGLHLLQPARINARVLLHVLEGPLLLSQHKGAPIDVDDWLLAHVVPEGPCLRSNCLLD